MSEHTKGPWTVNPFGIDHESNMIFASTLPNGMRRLVAIATTGSDAPKNRQLLAAAPELLEALEAVIAISDRKHDAWDAAKAAIAKARGN